MERRKEMVSFSVLLLGKEGMEGRMGGGSLGGANGRDGAGRSSLSMRMGKVTATAGNGVVGSSTVALCSSIEERRGIWG